MAAASGGRSKWRDPWELPAPERPGNLDMFKDNTYMLMVKDRDGDLLKQARPRDIYKSISAVIPNILHCKRLESGNFLVKIDKSQKESTLSITKIGDIPVKIEEPGAMNYTKVTIKHKDIPKYSNEELTEDLKRENCDVVSAEIQTSWIDKIEKKSEFAVVTLDGKFSEQQLQTKKLIYWWEKLHLKLYIPPPTRCKNCWAFDHYTSKKRPCTQKGICGFCGEDAHVDSEGNKIPGKCTKQRRCINCQKEDHPAWSKECVRYKEEQKIWRKMTEDRVSYNRATYILKKQEEERRQSLARKLNQQRQDYDTLLDDDDVISHNSPHDFGNASSAQQAFSAQQAEIKHLSKMVADLTYMIRNLCNVVVKQQAAPGQSEDFDEDILESENADSSGCSLNVGHSDSLRIQKQNFDLASSLQNSFQSQSGEMTGADGMEGVSEGGRYKRGSLPLSMEEPSRKRREREKSVDHVRGNNNPTAQFNRQKKKKDPVAKSSIR